MQFDIRLSVAATHSLVVIGISAIGLWLGREAFAGEATKWLEMASGLVAIGIGSWMMWRRLFKGNKPQEHHHHAPNPALFQGKHLQGTLEIIDTPIGEKMRFVSSNVLVTDELVVEIDRSNSEIEKLNLTRSPEDGNLFLSAETPGEPHEFSARLVLAGNNAETISFSMQEPEGHHHYHSHDHLDDEAHAKAHIETLPEYAKNGERPSVKQIMFFGAAGGMIPCPASITVMLLALSTGRTGMGIFTVLGFSLGLALALVSVGLVIVTGLSRLSDTGRLSWISKKAPVVNAGLVILSGVFALLIAH